jgi:hypothetical protein
MSTFKAQGTVVAHETIRVPDLPMQPGKTVTVEITEENDLPKRVRPSYPLRGTVLRYDRPFDPAIPDEEWESELFPAANEPANDHEC